MKRRRRGSALVPVALFVAVATAITLACESGTEPPDPGDASYSVALDPAQIIYATVNCDRYLSYAILNLGKRRQEFSLSINIMNDCTRAGGIWTYGEVYVEGRYAVADTVLSFTPDSTSTPPFSGTFDSTHVRLTLPARTDSLAAIPIPLRLGPKMPF